MARKGDKMKRVFGLIGIIVGIQFIVSLLAIADAPDTLWTKTYGGTGGDGGNSVQECAGGGFIIAGWTGSFGAGSADVYLIRTDADGDTLWTKTYGGAEHDYGYSVQECADSGFIIAGYTYSFGADLCDVYLIRTDADGDTLWTKTYGGTDYDFGYSVEECADSGFIIAGGTSSFGAGSYDVYLVRTDLDGDTLWTKTYGGTDYDFGYSVEECADSGFIIAGGTGSFGAGGYDVYFIRTDADGDTLWTKTYGGTSGDCGNSVEECADSGFIIAGETGSFSAGDVYLIRTDADGDTLWTKTYGGTEWDRGYSVQECAGGGFIIAGETKSFSADSGDVYLIRTDADGDTLWTRTYGETDWDEGKSVQECAGGGFIIAGYTLSFDAGNGDVYLIRIGPEEGIEESEKLRVESLELRVYPNPSFGNALIKYGLQEKASISLGLYDISGRLVKTIYSGTQEKGYYEVDIKQDGLIGGIYFIRFETSDFKATKKLTIIR